MTKLTKESTKTTYADIARYVGRHWGRFPVWTGTLIATMSVTVFFDLLFPIAYGRLVDAVAGVSGRPGTDDLYNAFFALGALIGLSICYQTFRHISMLLWMRFATKVMHNIVTEAFEQVQRFSTEWHAGAFAGGTVRKVSRGMWAYDTIADTVYVGFFPMLILLIGISTSLALHWPLVGLYVAIGALIHAGVMIYLSLTFVAPRNVAQVRADSEIGASLADAITCNPVVKSFGAEAREGARLRRVVGRWGGLAVRSWTSMEQTYITQTAVLLVMQVGLLSLVLHYWSEGLASAGDVAYAMTSYMLISIYLRDIGMHMQHLQQGANEIEDVVGFMGQSREVADAPEAAAFEPKGGTIKFEGVSFKYPNNKGKAAYRDFNLDIRAGERVALVGRSGSGKSTFVKLLQRLYDINEGRILIDGQNIARVTQESLRRSIALVPQEAILFHRSIADNIAYARPEATRAEMERAAAQAHVDEFVETLDQGYDTLVGERGVKLSGGERQRIAIARALLADAEILVLDEATASLDSVTEVKIQQAIESLMASRTTIVIAHRLSTIRQVDRVLVFEDGRIVEQGSHDALLARPDGQFRRLYATQQAGFLPAE